MNRETSLYLDVWRFALAVVVFLAHVSGSRFTGGFLWQLGPYASEAVAVFFVLSGLVIGYVTDRRERSVASYWIARAARIYSVALPALVLTFLLDHWGRSIRPDLYDAAWGYLPIDHVWQLLGAAVFAGGLWGLQVPLGSNLPYWSLGCEVWYYVIFGIILFAPARWRMVGAGVALALVGPFTALLFPLWLLGVLGYRLCRRPRLGLRAGWALYLGSVALWVGYEALAPWHGRFSNALPFRLPHCELMVQDYIVGLLFLGHIVGFRTVSSSFAGVLGACAGPIRWMAGATFTIYLFHLPIAQFIATLMPAGPSAWSSRAAVIVGTLGALLAVAELTERRKGVWKRALEVMVDRKKARGFAPGAHWGLEAPARSRAEKRSAFRQLSAASKEVEGASLFHPTKWASLMESMF